jgi:hypothetical protein
MHNYYEKNENFKTKINSDRQILINIDKLRQIQTDPPSLPN